MKTNKSVVLTLAVLLGSLSLAGGEPASGEPVRRSGAQQAFERLKSLVGRWEGSNVGNTKTIATFELVSNGSALLETYTSEGEGYSMITVYHLDGNRLLLTHYCGAKNQPRMQAESFSPAEGVLDFSFLDITNLSSPDEGHMRKVVFRFQDNDHFVAEWTWRENQEEKPTDVFRFRRVL